MKKISRILTMLLCCAPLSLVHAGPVATTNGSNLTSYNPSNISNNQWATISNGRYDGNTNTSAKADFNNCSSIILRCAQPKCANGGCADAGIAQSIVEGCIKANKTCEKYSEDLVGYAAAQLVASSNSKIKEQELALQQAKIQADAQSAAAQSEQIYEMNQQMQEMQRQMQQQREDSARQLQEALAEQSAQSKSAIEEMKKAATDAAEKTEAGISSYQQEAINRGISADVLERQTMTGQIMTDIEDAETSMVALKKTLENTFEYAHCDSRGNGCEGPKRIKKWRELAKDFIDPYDNAIDKIYDALQDAQGLGVDLSQIYMMLDDSCSSWAQYLCPQMENGQIYYNFTEENAKSKPTVCRFETKKEGSVETKEKTNDCVPCTMLKVLSGDEAIYEGWINAEKETKDNNVTIVACVSGVIDSNKFFARRARKKKAMDLVDVEVLDTWLSQTEPNYMPSGKEATDLMKEYCYSDDAEKYLESASSSKVAPAQGSKLCVTTLGGTTQPTSADECPFISPIYAICDTHQYNAGIDKVGGSTSAGLSEQTNKIKKMVGLKTTVVSQQMYKQYEYLNATLRRIKIQLEKAIVKTNLKAAGAKDDDSSSGGLAGGGSKSSQYTDCSGKSKRATADCLRDNYRTLASQINNKKCDTKVKKELINGINIANILLKSTDKLTNCSNSGATAAEGDKTCSMQPVTMDDCKAYLGYYASAAVKLDEADADDEARRRGYNYR